MQEEESTTLNSEAKRGFEKAAQLHPVAGRNLASLYRMDGKSEITEDTSAMEYQTNALTRAINPINLKNPIKTTRAIKPMRPKMNYPGIKKLITKKLKVGTALPANGNYRTVDEIQTADQNILRIVECPDQKALVLLEKGIIRLVAYREPHADAFEKNTQGSGDADCVSVSRETKNGDLFSGKRALFYFEF